MQKFKDLFLVSKATCHIIIAITLCIRETNKQVLLQTVKTQMKFSIMLHFIRVYTVFKDKKKSSDKKIPQFFSNYNLTPLDMYQVYCIKPKGRVH